MRWISHGLLCLLVSSVLNAQGQTGLEELLSHADLQSTQLSIHVRDLQGNELLEKNSKAAMMPASTMKLITTLSAIGVLGADYKFETTIGYTGELSQDKTLYGDLIVIGSGDPSLGSGRDQQVADIDELLSDWVEKISLKVSCIEGDLIIDAGIFDNVAINPGWAWDDLSNYYATGVWGLNLHENLYHLKFNRSLEPGDETSIASLEPKVQGLQLENKILIGSKGSGDEAYIFGDPYGLQKSITGTIPPGSSTFSIKGAIPDAREWFAQQLIAKLESKGIATKGYKLKKKEFPMKTLLVYKSPTLKDLARYANEVSNNLYCDAFYKMIGARHQQQGTWESAQKGILEYLSNNDINTSGYHQEDGSGLSMRNRVSCSFMTDFLQQHVNQLGVQELQSVIPKAGVNGSVRNFLNGYSAQSHAWLKSGSINAVVAYAGLLEVGEDSHVLISIASNGHQISNRAMRKHIERIIDEIYTGLSQK